MIEPLVDVDQGQRLLERVADENGAESLRTALYRVIPRVKGVGGALDCLHSFSLRHRRDRLKILNCTTIGIDP